MSARPAESGSLAGHLEIELAAIRSLVEGQLDSYLVRRADCPPRLNEAMRYSLLAGGKRLRPALVLLACEACGGTREAALPAACAVEMIHTYSLIHDDLPAMDDDDLRRGRPTNHKVYGEGLAILAGDALLTIAFEILADAKTHPDADVRIALIARLAEASGHDGMIGGQVIDMLAEESFGLEDVINLQRLKTGQLFEFSCEAGPILGKASPEDRARLRAYAREMGVVFQITDDLLDVTSTAEKTGKAVGKDADMGKATLVTLLGVEGARAELKQRGIKDADKAPIPDEVFRPQAERRVRLGLVVAELVRANELQAKPEQLKAHIDELAASYEKPEDVVRWYFSDRQRLAEVEAVVIENNVTDFVLGKAKVADKAITFEDLMGQQG